MFCGRAAFDHGALLPCRLLRNEGPDVAEQLSHPWQFYNPVKLQFGGSCRRVLPAMVQGQHLLIVTTRRGRAQFSADPVLGQIAAGDVTWMDSVSSNPGLADLQQDIDRLADQSFDAIIAFGGGSAIDAAKAMSAALAPGLATRNLTSLIACPGTLLDRPLVPIHAVTTTSGTGAEVTPFATIWDHANHKKLSLVTPRLFPATAIVDPDLTRGLPRDPTLSTGLDALNQAFESLWNRNRTPLSQAFATRAVGLGLAALPVLAQDLDNTAARSQMAEASMLAGLAISQTRTALCHSMSYPLTAHFGLAHGWACAATMAAVAQQAFAADPTTFDAVAHGVGLASADALLDRLSFVLSGLDLRAATAAAVPGLEQVLALIPEMFTPGRSDNFILPVDPSALETLLRESF
jgi:phosphonate metabolism-associated iron-containing alcohol dehydrogenase